MVFPLKYYLSLIIGYLKVIGPMTCVCHMSRCCVNLIGQKSTHLLLHSRSQVKFGHIWQTILKATNTMCAQLF